MDTFTLELSLGATHLPLQAWTDLNFNLNSFRNSDKENSLCKQPFSSRVIITHYAYHSCNCQARVLLLAPPIANWSVSIVNTTKNSITIQWPNLSPILNEQVLHYFGLIKTTNGSILNCHIMPANSTSVSFTGLLPYRQYRLSVVGVGVNGTGQAYSSSEVTAWTEEGGM